VPRSGPGGARPCLGGAAPQGVGVSHHPHLAARAGGAGGPEVRLAIEGAPDFRSGGGERPRRRVRAAEPARGAQADDRGPSRPGTAARAPAPVARPASAVATSTAPAAVPAVDQGPRARGPLPRRRLLRPPPWPQSPRSGTAAPGGAS
jgi:hypothetical protein